jgi:hypothetical protein
VPLLTRGSKTLDSKKLTGCWTVEAFDKVLREDTPRIGMLVDSFEVTPEETIADPWVKLENKMCFEIPVIWGFFV